MGTRGLGILGLIAGGGALWWLLQRDGLPIGAPLDLGGPIGGDPGGPIAPANTVEAFLQGVGLTPDQARGVAAGIWAESRMDPNAVNPTSGAFGIGQWLGSRKAELFRRYGSRPTLGQQLEFLAWELAGGDHGGKHVLAQTTAAGTLDAYIRRFMRPAAGAETAGDLERGARYLG